MSERLVARFHEGQIQWRGSDENWRYKPRDEADRLATLFERTMIGDWFRPHASEMAAQLREAIEAYDAWEESLVH